MVNVIKKTPLHQWHVRHGAHMADFADYSMPIWYPAGARREHLAVIQAAGVFDTSHMSTLMINGPDALELLQLCFTRDLKACRGKRKSPLGSGQCVYGVFLNASGEVIDDAIVYRISGDDYMIVVNSGMGGRIAEHLSGHAGKRSVRISDLSDKIGKIDIQGPAAAKILQRFLADPEKVFEKMFYFTFKGRLDPSAHRTDNVFLTEDIPIILSRTGYTGEFGFEIFVGSDQLLYVWEKVLTAGNDLGIIPCGLAARDSLRAGAGLPLAHQDIGPWPFVNTPWSFVLPYNSQKTGFNKTFIGDRALLEIKTPEYTYMYVGYDLRKVSIKDLPEVRDASGNRIGSVLSCVTDSAIGIHNGRIFSVASPDKPKNFVAKGLCCGFVKTVQKLDPGQVIEIRDKRRKIKVMVADDIRPHRTAFRRIEEMLSPSGKER